MSHIVVYESADGASGFERCGSLDAAIVAAERLRNVEGVTSPRIFRLEEVQFDFRPYFRVEVNDADPEPASMPVERTVIPDPPAMAAVPTPEPEPEPEPVVEAGDSEISEAEVVDTVAAVPDAAPSADPIPDPIPDPFASVDGSTDWVASSHTDAAATFEPEAELEAIFATDPEPVPENTGEALFDSLQDDPAPEASSIFDEVSDAATSAADGDAPVVDVPEPDSMVSVRKGLFGR